jgi:hypothetical protein
MQHRFACKVAVDEARRDRADLAPVRLDRAGGTTFDVWLTQKFTVLD